MRVPPPVTAAAIAFLIATVVVVGTILLGYSDASAPLPRGLLPAVASLERPSAGAARSVREGAALVSLEDGAITALEESAVQRKHVERPGDRAPGETAPLATRSSGTGRDPASHLAELGEFRLPGVARLAGTVRTPDGMPLAGCGVALLFPGRRRIERSEADDGGCFQFDAIPPGRGYRLRITPPVDFHEEVIALVLEDGSRQVDVVVREKGRGRLRLELFDTQGEPVRNLPLNVRDATGLAEGTRGVTDRHGRLTMDDVSSGSLVIESLAEPRLTVSGLRVEPDAEADAAVTAALGRQTLEGFVSAVDGAPLVGVRVNAAWSRRKGRLRSSVVQTARTDGRGRFVLHGLGPGRFVLSTVAVGYQRTAMDVDVPVVELPRLELLPIR